jgi:primosomal protein N' (replication factor Y) (superfamily II helicase)
MIIPAGMNVKYEKRIRLLKEKYTTFKDNMRVSDIPDSELPILKKAIFNKDIEEYYFIKEKVAPKIQETIELINDEPVKAHRQQEIIDYLKENKNSKKETILKNGFSASSLKTLEKNKKIRIIKNEVYREINHDLEQIDKVIKLNFEQEKAYQKIKEALFHEKTFLLHGVTGSGKTEIYLQIIQDVIAAKKEAIFLVPEISLTPQMVQRFKSRFDNEVALLHSGLSIGEKYDEWRKILRKEAKIVIGARSAIFAPLTNLGIIIIDEEHEDSYKQNEVPKYNARDVALYRSKKNKIPLVLGSATPSIISYTKAIKKDYEILKINNRAGKYQMPEVHIVDMAQEFKANNRSMFSKLLMSLIEQRLESKEQIILLLNRRGHSSFVMCRECGEVIKCPHCDISLTYYQTRDIIKCHYCGYSQPNVTNCPSCKSKYIKYVGTGTEKVEEALRASFPSARILRMDADTTKAKGAHEKIINAFSNHKADILVGTQMVAKGLDFKFVTLVGILMADMTLRYPDYKNSERTYQLITQVSGRAGRHDIKGDVVIQAYDTEHFSIKYSALHDYDKFYYREINNRRLAKYPPFINMSQIIVAGKDKKDTMKEALIICKMIKNKGETINILGPALALKSRIKEMYRVQIMLKYAVDISDILFSINEKYQDNKEFSITIDNDPIF